MSPERGMVRKSRFGKRPTWVLAGAMTVAATFGAPSARADDGELRYQAFAAAEGVRLGVLVPGASAVDQIVDGGAPVAQAVLNSLGTSAGFAAQPYPGDVALVGPGLAATLLGLPPPPGYPFIATSRNPSVPEASVEPIGFYRLHSKSDDVSSAAEARAGHAGPDGTSNGGFSEAMASVARHGDYVSAEASNRVEAVTAGPLRVGTVVSRAKVGRVAGQDAERASELNVTGLSINGQAVGLTEAGLVLAGTHTPLPPSDPLLAVLAQAKVKVSYLKAEVTPNGVVAPGLQVVTVETIPGAERSATASLTLGRASANVEATGALAALPGNGPAPIPPAEAGTVTANGPAAAAVPVAEWGTANAPVPPVPAVSGIRDVALPVLASPVTGGVDALPASPVAVAPPVRVAPTAGWRAAPVGRVSSGAFYPLLVLIGVLVMAGLRVVRGAGVKR